MIASAAGSLVYDIPECKPYLESKLKKSAEFLRVSGIGYLRPKRKRPAVACAMSVVNPSVALLFW